MRVVITGGPRVGKTTFAAALLEEMRRQWPGMTCFATDDMIGAADWSEQSAELAERYLQAGPWLIEGVTNVRALRKFLDRDLGDKPCDVVIYFDYPVVELTSRQEGMRKSCRTIFDQARERLESAGVVVLEWPDFCPTLTEVLERMPLWNG